MKDVRESHKRRLEKTTDFKPRDPLCLVTREVAVVVEEGRWGLGGAVV